MSLSASGGLVRTLTLGLMLVFIYVPLCWVRKIEKLAVTHVFADVMIVVTIISVLVYTFQRYDTHGFQDVPAINGKTYLDVVGSMVYSYEGVGVIIPVFEVAQNPKNVPRILGYVLTTVLVVYLIFGFSTLFVYGKELKVNNIITQTITTLEDPDHPDYFMIVIKIAFSFNLIFSYPLVIYPANMILEDNLFKGWPKS